MKWLGHTMAGGVLALLVIAALYATSYSILVQIQDQYIVNLGTIYCAKVPGYRIGGEAADAFFQPVHDIDRWLRPETWKSQDVSELPTGVGGFF